MYCPNSSGKKKLTNIKYGLRGPLRNPKLKTNVNNSVLYIGKNIRNSKYIFFLLNANGKTGKFAPQILYSNLLATFFEDRS